MWYNDLCRRENTPGYKFCSKEISLVPDNDFRKDKTSHQRHPKHCDENNDI